MQPRPHEERSDRIGKNEPGSEGVVGGGAARRPRGRVGGRAVRLTPEERLRLATRRADPEGSDRREREAEAERRMDRRLWASVMLTADVEVCRSTLLGHRVLARQLEPAAVRRALRGGSFPPDHEYIQVSAEMLDAVAEGGLLTAARHSDDHTEATA